MKKEYPEDVDAVLWKALNRAFWAYAVKMKSCDSGRVTDKMTKEVEAFLAYIKDQEVCYDDE